MWRQLSDIKDLLLLAESGDVLELDEIWSFVLKKAHTRWLWTAMCRRTRHTVAFVIGDRSKATCLRLRFEIPDEYKHCHTFGDFWSAYQQVFPAETQRSVGKETGETAHKEQWNNTLRQRVGRYVPRTLSFSQYNGTGNLGSSALFVLMSGNTYATSRKRCRKSSKLPRPNMERFTNFRR